MLKVADGVVNSSVPPELAVNQRNVPADPVEADNVTVPVLHRDPGVTVGVLAPLITVAVTALRGETQTPLSNDT